LPCPLVKASDIAQSGCSRNSRSTPRDAVSARYRFVAPDQRYFGSAPRLVDGAKHSLATHASGLAAFFQQLRIGPVHLVGTSYGGAVALVLAVQRPDLVRSLSVNEPALE